MKLGVLFSGGKDSTHAAYLALKRGHELACLITLESENKASYMFHTPSISQVGKQAEAMGVPLLVFKTKGEKEKELGDLKKAISEARKEHKIEGIVTGALASEYQASRIGKICSDLKLASINPLWHKDPEKYWDELLADEFEIMIVGVAADGLGKEWLGKIIDKELFEKLRKLSKKHNFHLAFEGGEAETFVLDCPLFEKRIEVLDGEIIWSGNSGVYEIKKLKLAEK